MSVSRGVSKTTSANWYSCIRLNLLNQKSGGGGGSGKSKAPIVTSWGARRVTRDGKAGKCGKGEVGLLNGWGSLCSWDTSRENAGQIELMKLERVSGDSGAAENNRGVEADWWQKRETRICYESPAFLQKARRISVYVA